MLDRLDSGYPVSHRSAPHMDVEAARLTTFQGSFYPFYETSMGDRDCHHMPFSSARVAGVFEANVPRHL